MRKLLLIVPQLLLIGLAWGQVDYQTQIQTIFNANCTSCHINGGAYQQGLDLSSYDSLMAGSNNGAVIVPGDHANSLLWQKVNSGTMPPGNNPDLGAGEINLIAQWIDEGALENPVYAGPVWHVATTGSDETGNGSEANPFATIQKGIDTSSDGDTVMVAAGTYEGFFAALNINHRYILSSSGRDSTIILNTNDFMGSGAQDADSIFVDGFTFDDGQWGFAVFDCTNIYISNIRITNIEQETDGPSGAVYSDGSPVFIDNIVIDNCISTAGAIIWGVTEITNMTLVNSFQGGENFVFVPNGAISNSIVWNNRYLYDNETVVNLNTFMFTFSILEGYGGNNPLFCDPENGDYSLAANSPCVGTGENGANMGAFGVGCGIINQVFHVATTGSDETGNGSETNPFATIQAGIDAAFDGDTVLVAAGSYITAGNFICNNIYLIGENRETTFIDGDTWALIYFNMSNSCNLIIENSYLYVENFTINGRVQTIFVDDVSFENVHIINDTNFLPSLRVLGAVGDFIINNSIIENYNNYAIEINGEANTTINLSTIIVHDSNNGIINLQNENNNTSTIISNSIILGDTSLFTENSNFSNLSVMYSNIEGGWDGTGNIDANPLFCNADSSDYTLAENSPCVGTGENGVNMGALGVGCEAIILAPVLATIDDQQIEEDGSVTLEISATSAMGLDMTFSVYNDTPDVIVSLDNTTLTATPEPDWYGTSVVTVMVTDENESSDTTDFTLTVASVNDSPEPFLVLYPTVSDTFSTHVDSDTAIVFNWEESYDVDSDVTYTLTIELEFFGNTYTDVHENIIDTTISISSNSLDALLNVISQDIATFTYYVNSSDGEYMVASDVGEFVLFRAALGVNEGLSVPVVYALHQNYPNPFNPETTLRYDLPENSLVNITIYDMLGREIRTLVNATQDAGFKSVIWNATNDYGKPVSAGVYLYQIRAGKFVQTKKMVLLK